MANKVASRGISVYIDGKEVESSVKSIRSAMNKLINEQAKMTIGSKDYVAAGKKIAELNSILDYHKKQQKEISEGYNRMSKNSKSFTDTLSGGLKVFAGNLMTKALSFLSNALGETVDTIRSFEKANVFLAAVLGKNVNDIKALTNSAIELGKASKYTASQVTELQTELAKLGFEEDEILNIQKHVLNFATALDAGLGEAAEVAGASLRAFGADSSEAERYLSAMTIGANKTALGFESLATAMPIVAPVANAFNFTIEDTVALLGQLSNSGFDASTSATALRNILLNLADSNGKLAKAIGAPVKNLDDLVAGLDKLNKSGIDLATSLELTDKRSVAAFQTFLKGAQDLIPLRDSITDVGGELQILADAQMDNLDGSVLSLKSSWEALMLAFSSSSGFMKIAVDGLTSLVDKIRDVIVGSSDLETEYTNQIEKVADLETSTVSLLERYNDLISETSLNKDEQEELLKIMNHLNDTIPVSIGEFDEYGNILSINTQKVYEYIEAEKARLQYINQESIEQTQKSIAQSLKLIETLESRKNDFENNPFDIAVSDFLYDAGAAGKVKEFEEAINKEKGLLKGAQEELRRLEGRNVEEDLAYQKGLIEHRLQFNAMNQEQLKAWIDDEKNAANEYLNIARQLFDQRNKIVNNTGGGGAGNEKEAEQRKRITSALRKVEEQHLKDMSDIKSKYLNGDIKTEEEYNKLILKQQEAYDDARKKELEKLLKSVTSPSLRIDIAKQIADIDSKAYDRQISEMEKRRKALAKWNDEETKKIVQAALKSVDTMEAKAEQELALLRAKDEISDAEYRKRLLENEEKYLEERLRINGLTDEEIIKFREQLNLNRGETDINNAETRTSALDEFGLRTFEDEQQKKLDMLKYYEEQGILTHDEATKAKQQIDQEYIAHYSEQLQSVLGNVTGTMTNLQSAEESAVSRKYDKQISAAEGNASKQKKLEEKKQKELNSIRAKYADKQFAVTVAQTISTTALAAMEAYKAMAGIPIVGPALGAAAAAAAVAYGASQIKVAKEQRDAAKAGYYDGGYYIDEGYTGGNDPRQVRGILPDGSEVHGEEFISNHHLTSRFKPLFNLFDEAQKHKTVSSLTKSDIAKALNINSGYIEGGFTGTPSASVSTSKNTQNDMLSERFIDVMERLYEKLGTDFRAYVTYKGEGGIEEVEDLDERMKRNVTR